MKILLVEDDHIIWPNIKEYLEETWFLVNLVSDGKEGFIKAIDWNYDLIILDVMLPSKDGFSIARQLRQLKVQTPIIFLTAKEDLESKETWFLAWWDDYLTKPFKLKELVLRIKSILKRINHQKSINEIQECWITLNLDTKQVFREEKEIQLTPKEFNILEYLMKNKWKAVPKHEIVEYVWWINNDIWSDVVRTHIKTLRDKINNWFDYDPIQTIRWVGFKFECKE